MAAILPLLAGCSAAPHTPAISVFGSFFPVWIICVALGVLITVVVRQTLIRLGIDEHLPVPALVYLCLVVLSSIVLWGFWSGALNL